MARDIAAGSALFGERLLSLPAAEHGWSAATNDQLRLLMVITSCHRLILSSQSSSVIIVRRSSSLFP